MSEFEIAPIIVAAMRSELAHALGHGRDFNRRRAGAWPIWSGYIDDQPVHLVLSGIGMVNASAAISRMIAVGAPAAVFNIGCAGAHRPDILPGDVVVGTEFINHRSIAVLPSHEERFLGSRVNPENESEALDVIRTSDSLLESVKTAAREWQPEPWPFVANPARPPVVHFGAVASADTWTQSTERIASIHATHGTLCEDMEAAALAQVCFMCGILFLGIKDISNNEFHDSTDHDAAGPSLQSVESELGRRAFDLLRRVLPLVRR